MNSDWIEAAAKEICRDIGDNSSDAMTGIMAAIRRHGPPQPGEGPQAVPIETEVARLIVKAIDDANNERIEDSAAAPQPSPSPVDVEKISRALSDAERNDCMTFLMTTQEAATLLAEVRELRSDTKHAMREARRRVPHYPWSQNTMSEVVWALGESYRGSTAANHDLHAELAAAQAREKRLREMLKRSMHFREEYPSRWVNWADFEIAVALQKPSDGNPPTP